MSAVKTWDRSVMTPLPPVAPIERTLAIGLALIAGYVDGYGLYAFATYVSFMSGNTTNTGLKTGQGDFQGAFLSTLAIVFFVSGSFLGNLLSQFKWRHCHRLVFSLIAAGLAVVNGLELAGLRDAPLEIALLCAVMGMMNPALSKIGAESVSLTFVTGTLSRIDGHLALLKYESPWRTHRAEPILTSRAAG